MENTSQLDIVLGIIALAIVIIGLIMLFQGISAMEERD